MPRAVPAALLALAAGAAIACATGGGPPVVRPTVTARGTMNVLTAAELREAPTSTASLSERVQVLRVGFLHGSGPQPVVLVDGRYAGPATVLDGIPVHVVREIRLLRGTEVPLVDGRRHAVALNVILRR